MLQLRLILVFVFISSIAHVPHAQAGEIVVPLMPKPGVMVNLSPAFIPAHLQGITIHTDNALKIDFLIHKGEGQLDRDQKQREYDKLIKYFLASLTIPDEDQWVNLSPYEHDRIIKDNFGKTEMGRDLLSQDYFLKQITSSLMYPESGLGKKFWNKVYERAHKEYGVSNIPVNTFNKVWIIPDQAVVYESGNTVYILKSHLKVMLAEDYLALEKNVCRGDSCHRTQTARTQDSPIRIAKIVKEIILPEIEQEVNEGKNFAMLRQIYSAMILATWYKKSLKESLLGKVYADKAKVMGVDLASVKAAHDFGGNAEIYQKYLSAFKKGVYNYIKEEFDQFSHQIIPRKYFAGGFGSKAQLVNKMKVFTASHLPSQAMVEAIVQDFAQVNIDKASVVLGESKNPRKRVKTFLSLFVTAISLSLPQAILPEKMSAQDQQSYPYERFNFDVDQMIKSLNEASHLKSPDKADKILKILINALSGGDQWTYSPEAVKGIMNFWNNNSDWREVMNSYIFDKTRKSSSRINFQKELEDMARSKSVKDLQGQLTLIYLGGPQVAKLFDLEQLMTAIALNPRVSFSASHIRTIREEAPELMGILNGLAFKQSLGPRRKLIAAILDSGFELNPEILKKTFEERSDKLKTKERIMEIVAKQGSAELKEVSIMLLRGIAQNSKDRVVVREAIDLLARLGATTENASLDQQLLAGLKAQKNYLSLIVDIESKFGGPNLAAKRLESDGKQNELYFVYKTYQLMSDSSKEIDTRSKEFEALAIEAERFLNDFPKGKSYFQSVNKLIAMAIVLQNNTQRLSRYQFKQLLSKIKYLEVNNNIARQLTTGMSFDADFRLDLLMVKLLSDRNYNLSLAHEVAHHFEPEFAKGVYRYRAAFADIELGAIVEGGASLGALAIYEAVDGKVGGFDINRLSPYGLIITPFDSKLGLDALLPSWKIGSILTRLPGDMIKRGAMYEYVKPIEFFVYMQKRKKGRWGILFKFWGDEIPNIKKDTTWKEFIKAVEERYDQYIQERHKLIPRAPANIQPNNQLNLINVGPNRKIFANYDFSKMLIVSNSGKTRIVNVSNVIPDIGLFTANKGGIDLNGDNLNLQIKRDAKVVPLPLVRQDLKSIDQFQGFTPIIITIVPVTAVPQDFILK